MCEDPSMTIAVTAASGRLGREIVSDIAGIWEGIRNGALDVPGDDEAAAGRPHRSWAEVCTRP